MTMNAIQIPNEISSLYNDPSKLLSQGVKVFSTGLALYCGMQLIDSGALIMKEAFFPDLLSAEEKLDINQAELEWEIEDIRSDCINPIEIAKLTFVLIHLISKFIKINNLCSVVGINQSIKEKISSAFTSVKNRVMNPFRPSINSPKSLTVNSLSILDDIESFNESLNDQLVKRENTNDPMKIGTAALDVVDIVIPHSAITLIVQTGKLLSELKKPIEEENPLHVSKKIFSITGYASKAVAELTPCPGLGKIVGQVALTTSNVLKIIDKENAA